MLSIAEQRVSVRYGCSGGIRFTLFNRAESIHANLVDISEEGLGFLSTVELKPGYSLVVQVEHVESTGFDCFKCRLARSLGIVEVKWCRPVGDQWNTLYAVGVKYLLTE